ncbi:MAG: hypothetical protein C0478_10055 [Planctomyces sp.]|nr:hypothetical protein [Planctomyces sp.]
MSSKLSKVFPRWLWHSASATALFSTIGCSSGGPDLVELQGKVLSEGKPVPGVSVEYQPVDGKGSPSLGYTDQDGNFRLRFSRDRFGALRGEHQVRLSIEFEPGGDAPPPDFKIPPRYNKQSELKVQVPGLDSEHAFNIELEPFKRNAGKRNRQIAER